MLLPPPAHTMRFTDIHVDRVGPRHFRATLTAEIQKADPSDDRPPPLDGLLPPDLKQHIDEVRRAVVAEIASKIRSLSSTDVLIAVDQRTHHQGREMHNRLLVPHLLAHIADLVACTCPDCDVTPLGKEPGSATVKGLDPDCPQHGNQAAT